MLQRSEALQRKGGVLQVTKLKEEEEEEEVEVLHLFWQQNLMVADTQRGKLIFFCSDLCLS